VYKDAVTNDFENVPLPGLNDDGIVAIGFDDPKQGWPDFRDIFEPEWAKHFSFKDDELWTNGDFNQLPAGVSTMAESGSYQ
jgi:hypothetical protein